MQPTHPGWIRWLMLAACALMVATSGVAVAQTNEVIRMGEQHAGKITQTQPNAYYAIGVNGTQTLDIYVKAGNSGLVPWFRVLDQTLHEIGQARNPDAAVDTNAVVALPEPGLYYIEVAGENQTTGAFTIVVYQGPSVPGATELRAGDAVAGVVSAETPEQVYDINSSVEGVLFILLRNETPEAGPNVELRNEIIDRTLGNGEPLLAGVAFLLERGDSSYSLRVRYGGSGGAETYRVCVARVEAVAGCFTESEPNEPA